MAKKGLIIKNSIVVNTSISANGTTGTTGQALFSNGTSLYWATVAGFTNGQSISVNNFVVTGTVTANGSNGTANQVLTSNGTASYWATTTAGTTVGKAIALAIVFG
jgi:hypothetical protein